MVFIDSVKFGEIVIDGKTYYSDMFVAWSGKIEMIPKSQFFSVSDYQKLKTWKPDTIILGCGMENGLTVEEDFGRIAEKDNIDLFVERTPQAIRLFNSLVSARRKVVAIIHTTC
ncbi:MAG: MTH938/NDUFAF3 family protein [Candidatus Aenigmatarchaeota archaeon]